MWGGSLGGTIVVMSALGSSCDRTDMTSHAHHAFHHEALFYERELGFLAGALPFVRDALAAQAPILVAVSAAKIGLLRAELGADAARVRFADMAQLGRNPGRIISAWHDFAAEHGADGEPLYGIGEPIWAGRSEAELAECHRHEALLNLAFADRADFRLLCPYDTGALPPGVVAQARRTHPHLSDVRGTARSSGAYLGDAAIRAPFAAPLEPAPHEAMALTFDADTLGAVRLLVTHHADAAGIGPARRDDLVLAVNELATNSVRHGGGHGRLRAWMDGRGVVCEVRDGGRIAEPLVGRERPVPERVGGYGLWLVQQLCDLVELRSPPEGTVVRVHVRR